MTVWLSAILIIIAFLITSIVSFYLGKLHRKNVAESEIGSAEQEAKRIINDAIKTAETKKKEVILEGKDEVHKQRTEMERELKERRKSVQRQERRIQQREENLEKKLSVIENREEKLTKRSKRIDENLKETEKLRKKQNEALERISGFTTQEAKKFVLDKVNDELIHEKASKIVQFQQSFKEDADEIARKIISLAIQRCAVDHVAEATISVVQLPNDDMKGRIIGREGRNIRSIENITGVNLIIDDTPETITISSFDPIRREVARITLERLIADGRIHPGRIEEVFEKAKKELDFGIKQEGARAIIDANVNGVHPELVKLIGRLKYRTSYGQNVLKHSLEACYLCEIMAAELGLDTTIAKRAGLLHDIGKALSHEIEGSHVDIGVDIAKRFKESQEVIHAIQAHHGDVEAKTPLDFIVQVADAISAARPGARRENIETYIKRLEKLEQIASSFEGVERCFAIQAGREIRIMVNPEIMDDDDMVLLAKNICQKIENNLQYPGQIKITIIRENRIIEYAR